MKLYYNYTLKGRVRFKIWFLTFLILALFNKLTIKYSVSGSKFSTSSLPTISTSLSINIPISSLSTRDLRLLGTVKLSAIFPVLRSLGISIPSEDKASRMIKSFIEKKYFLFLLIFLCIPTKSLLILSLLGFSSVKILTNFDLCNILPTVEGSAKASLMSSYCLYLINFYSEAEEGLERFIRKYPADKNITYAYYLLVIINYEQILDESKDITPLITSKEKIVDFLERYPDTEYALDLKFKLDLIDNQLAAKEIYIAKYYIETKKWIPAINRLKIVVKNYDETIFIEEALHRLVEVYYMIGLEEEAKTTAALLGYNYNSSEWYQQSYKLLNKDYKIPKKKKPKKDKDKGIIKRTIKKILG